MKEKIIDFSNGKFTYEQPKLILEPSELEMELGEGDEARGSIRVSSSDERRVKGTVLTEIPGMTLYGNSFFARAARVEFSYTPRWIRPGEQKTGRLLFLTSAGEYEIPVQIRIRSREEAPEKEEIPLPSLPEKEPEETPFRKGRGRSAAWTEMRKQEEALFEIERELEKERRGACTPKESVKRLRELADRLRSADAESAFYLLLDAWVMIREDRREEAGWILRKYERTRLFQQREVSVRALFLYVNTLYQGQGEKNSSGVAQLQKLYQRYPENWLVTACLLELDPKLSRNTRTRYMVLERQFRMGTRNRLLYQEAWNILSRDPALFEKLDAFTLQTLYWAASRGLLTPEAAQAAARQASRLKNWSWLSAKLLKACYQVQPCKETAGAVCSIYIRGHRTDSDAFVWYQKGVELDARITNLYEYFMYALPENYSRILPKQVILYFSYHNTLTSHQKTVFYCNLARYGSREDPACEAHRRPLQEFLMEQLSKRKVNEDLAWLYERCLRADTLEEHLLEALADVLFLRKLTCEEKRIRQVEVRYEELEERIRVPLAGGEAYVPVYTPGAQIVLIDEEGREYRRTVPYSLKKVLIEPRFMQACVSGLKHHTGLNLYLLEGKGKHRLNSENAETAYRLLEDSRIKESWRRRLKIELLKYERKHGRMEKLDERLSLGDAELGMLTGEERASYMEVLAASGDRGKAFELLEQYGADGMNARSLLRLILWKLGEGGDHKSLIPFAVQVFRQGVYTEQILALLAEYGQGSAEELLAVWKAAEDFGLCFPALEEQILAQALFTEHHVCQVFPVFEAMDDRGGDRTLCMACLNYLGWLDFVRGQEVPEGLFASLEHHFIWEDRLSEAAGLSYLKQLSVLLLLTEVQKKLVRKMMKELGEKRRYFAFMQKLSPFLTERVMPDGLTVVEYRCNPAHRVILHYVLEYHGKKTFDYMTERIYPVCGGVFSRGFVLFYGERLTWFFTEEREDGSSVSTECRTQENREEQILGGGRYQRLCQMQKALDCRQDRKLKKMMAEYEELTDLAETQFHRK